MAAEQPNILFIMADQFRDAALGFRDADPTYTPCLAGLAAESADVTHAVSSYPVCSPHRAMMMTGQHPHRNGVPMNINSRTGVGIHPDIDTWSRVLQESGYQTGYIGKWHLEAVTAEDAVWGEGFREGAVWDAYSPPDRRHGFSFWYSYGAADNHLRPHYWIGDAPREEKTIVDQWSVEHETDVAIDFLRTMDESDGPFALVVSHNPPHQPFDQAPTTFRGRYADLAPSELLPRPNVDFDSAAGREAMERAPEYFAAVSAVDEQIGRLLEALEETGHREDTIVVFTSDHGMQLGSHELMYKNVPWEESMSLPFLIRWPGHIAPGVDERTLIGSVDIAPTLLGLTGLTDRIPPAMQGTDVSADLLDRTRSASAGAGSAIYYGPPASDGGPGMRGLRTTASKLLIDCRNDPCRPGRYLLTPRLFDLAADPYEMHDLAATKAASVQDFCVQLFHELDAIGDTWPALEELRALTAGHADQEPAPAPIPASPASQSHP